MNFIKRNPKIFLLSGKARSGKNEISKMNLVWPDNYINKATEMGLYKNLDASNPIKKCQEEMLQYLFII